MRLFLLPVSTRRTLIYCERVRESATPGTKPPITERVINKANETWLSWEKKDKGWQYQVTRWGNQLFRRIPYEEWGLKSIPPLTQKRIEELEQKKLEFHCSYPSAFIKKENALDVLGTLAKERQAFHWQRLIYCLIGMPISAPFMIVPVVPNLPFYYLCFRAYSHYRALYGGKMLQHIVDKKLVDVQPSQVMDEMYVAGLQHPTKDDVRAKSAPSKQDIDKVQSEVVAQAQGDREVMLLKKWNGELLAEALHLPELQVEVERAVEQVEKAIASNTAQATTAEAVTKKT